MSDAFEVKTDFLTLQWDWSLGAELPMGEVEMPYCLGHLLHITKLPQTEEARIIYETHLI